MASKAQKYPDMWVDPEDDPRGNDSAGSSEREVLLDYLRHFRLTFEMKCDGLDAEQMARRSVEPSLDVVARAAASPGRGRADLVPHHDGERAGAAPLGQGRGP